MAGLGLASGQRSLRPQQLPADWEMEISWLPSGHLLQFAIEAMAIEIVDKNP